MVKNNCSHCSFRSNEFTKSELPISLAHMRYNTLREKSPRLLGVFYSTIHGRGLFTRRDIQEGEMVIEYVGEVTFLFIFQSVVVVYVPELKITILNGPTGN